MQLYFGLTPGVQPHCRPMWKKEDILFTTADDKLFYFVQIVISK